MIPAITGFVAHHHPKKSIEREAIYDELTPNGNWPVVAQEMKSRLDEHFMDFFIRSYGDLPDKRIDASVMGLAAAEFLVICLLLLQKN